MTYNKSHHRKRTQAEYEQEIEDAVKRFKRYPERLIAAFDSSEWLEFLDNIGINPSAAQSDFFENVREKTIEVESGGLTDRELRENLITFEIVGKIRPHKILRASNGQFTSAAKIKGKGRYAK